MAVGIEEGVLGLTFCQARKANTFVFVSLPIGFLSKIIRQNRKKISTAPAQG